MKRITPAIDIRLLGSFRVQVAGNTLSFPYQKPQMLLAYLITEARAIYRGHLSSLLWPDRSDHHSRQNLRQAMASLKHLLGDAFDELFVSSRQTIEFIGHERCNIDIDKLKVAIQRDSLVPAYHDGAGVLSLQDLYSGPFCQGFHVPGSKRFDEWLESRQEEFRSLAVTLGHRLIDGYQQEQQEHQVIQSYTQLLAIERHDESLINEFMKYLVRQGRRLQAITLFREHATRLKLEYGLQPDSHLVSLYESLTHG